MTEHRAACGCYRTIGDDWVWTDHYVCPEHLAMRRAVIQKMADDIDRRIGDEVYRRVYEAVSRSE